MIPEQERGERRDTPASLPRHEEVSQEYEAMLRTIEELYMRGKIPTVAGIMRMFGVDHGTALKLLADFHARYPLAMPITFTAIAKSGSPLAFWGLLPRMTEAGRRSRLRLGPPGVPHVESPLRRRGWALMITALMIIVLALVLMVMM